MRYGFLKIMVFPLCFALWWATLPSTIENVTLCVGGSKGISVLQI